MTIRSRVISLGAAAALAVGIGTYAFAASSEQGGAGVGPPFMRQMGAGMMKGMGPAMMGHDTDTRAQMTAVHELFVNHDRITRTVTNLPDGIRTVTESDDPRIAQIVAAHEETRKSGPRVTPVPGGHEDYAGGRRALWVSSASRLR